MKHVQTALLLVASLVWAGCTGEIVDEFDDDTVGDDDTADDDDTVDDDTADDDDTTEEPPCDALYDPIVAAFESELAQLGAPGAAFAVIEGGEVTCAAGRGTRTPGEDDPVRSTTLFRIGSVTKMLTAAALLQQVEDGAVDLEASVEEYVPYFSFPGHPEWTADMIVQHTIEQATGMYDYTEIDGYDDPDDLAMFFDEIYGQYLYLMAPPGRFYNYSNPNFMLAGLIVEEASGQYYSDYMDEHVFGPLGMDRTFFDGDDVIADGDYAIGEAYDWTGQTTGTVDSGPDSYDNMWGRPAGFAWSSVLDMATYTDFLMAGDPGVLADPWRQAMSEPQICTEEYLDLAHYGYGVFIYTGFYLGYDFYELPLATHSGAIPGFAAEMYALPDQELAIVILATTDGAYFGGTVATALMTLAELPTPSQGPDLTVDPADFDEMEGTYLDEYFVGEITVERQGDTLTVDIPLMDLHGYAYDPALVPATPDNFVLYAFGTSLLVTFIRDADGDPEYFRTRYFVGEITEGEPTDPPAVMPTAGPEFFERMFRDAARQPDPLDRWFLPGVPL